MKYLRRFNENLNSIGQDLQDILLEINDESLWKAECWPANVGKYFNFSASNSDSADSQAGKWIVVIQTVDEDEEYELEGQTPPPIVIECIERSIDFMNSEGFTNCGITFEMEEDDQIEEIDIDGLSDLDVWPNNFIRIEFWK